MSKKTYKRGNKMEKHILTIVIGLVIVWNIWLTWQTRSQSIYYWQGIAPKEPLKNVLESDQSISGGFNGEYGEPFWDSAHNCWMQEISCDTIYIRRRK